MYVKAKLADPSKIAGEIGTGIIMTLTNTFILCGIIAAFTIFAVVLAWGEHQTRHLNRDGKEKLTKRGGPDEPFTAQTRLPAREEGNTIVAANSQRREAVHS
jgi:hypothetical protein